MEKQYLIKPMTTTATTTPTTTTTTTSSVATLSPTITPTPTTFVQADPNTFKDLVQKLTGSSGNSDKLPVTHPARQVKPANLPVDPTGPRRSPFKLQDRRQTMRKLEIKLSLATITGNHHHHHQHHHPWLDSPTPSPVTPLSSDSLFVPGSASPSPSPASEEERAVAEKGFFLHPSPLTTPRSASDPPELLNLFPLTSPSAARSSSRQAYINRD